MIEILEQLLKQIASSYYKCIHNYQKVLYFLLLQLVAHFKQIFLKLTPRIITFAFSLSFMGMRIMRLSHSDKHTHTPFEVTENEYHIILCQALCKHIFHCIFCTVTPALYLQIKVQISEILHFAFSTRISLLWLLSNQCL